MYISIKVFSSRCKVCYLVRPDTCNFVLTCMIHTGACHNVEDTDASKSSRCDFIEVIFLDEGGTEVSVVAQILCIAGVTARGNTKRILLYIQCLEEDTVSTQAKLVNKMIPFPVLRYEKVLTEIGRVTTTFQRQWISIEQLNRPAFVLPVSCKSEDAHQIHLRQAGLFLCYPYLFFSRDKMDTSPTDFIKRRCHSSDNQVTDMYHLKWIVQEKDLSDISQYWLEDRWQSSVVNDTDDERTSLTQRRKASRKRKYKETAPDSGRKSGDSDASEDVEVDIVSDICDDCGSDDVDKVMHYLEK